MQYLLATPFRSTYTGDEHPGVSQVGPEDVIWLMEDVLFSVLFELVDKALF